MWELEPDLIWPIIGALVGGGLVGFEREARGRPAGLRTHTLVCLTSAMLMVAAAHQGRWSVGFIPGENITADPTRMAHGILTGIGFLCGGVIFKHGFSVQGLTTAASLWAVAGLGVLYGTGLYGVAVVGNLLILVVLVGLRWIDEHLPRKTAIVLEVRYARDRAPSDREFVQTMRELGCGCSGLAQRLTAEGRILQHSAKIRASRECVKVLAANLLADPAVVEYAITPRDD
ncbi:MgtC/SapB family protein [Caulobacter sp. 17J80-11]|uniref:MgtC/SapB family protein n=1 Tax=Caulobacter sp. 17J80-11 TaxID=2763502 RepID=UPI001653BBC3|nr:MgtC/SapB family protein [Caulobacter sp. 17J80-11]MBC6980291.1 MgtC/SapB family protein [Caulobacter sp. 17J80-11]